MGDMADYYIDTLDWDFERENDREEEYAFRGIWPAKTGEIPVIEMDDAHLANALAYIQKNNPNSSLRDMLEKEIKKRSRCIEVTTDSAVKEDEKEIFFLEVRGISIYTWAIRQKSTGYFLPARKKGRGFSFDEPTKDCFPRLFPSKLSATRALTAWLQGQWKRKYHTREVDGWPEDIEYITSEKVEGRNRDDMEIVEFALLEVTK